MNIRSQYLPWPAVGTSIFSIHHPVVGIRLDGRYTTSKNYKHIIMNLITLNSLISLSNICILCLQRTTHRMLPEAAGGPVSASSSHCRVSQLTSGLLYLLSLSVCPSPPAQCISNMCNFVISVCCRLLLGRTSCSTDASAGLARTHTNVHEWKKKCETDETSVRQT